MFPAHLAARTKADHRDMCQVLWSDVLCCHGAGVVEQVIDCSGGDDINEESGGKRKAAALLQVLRAQVPPP